MLQELIYEKKNEIGILKINRPEALNALNINLLKEIEVAIINFCNDDDIKVIMFIGEGKAFVAGADISEMRNMSVLEAKKFGELGNKVFRMIEVSEKPVIAAVNGYALGGGCELAMSCDIRIASEEAKFGQPEVCLGIIPGFGGTQRLSRLVGIAKSKELIFTGNVIGAEEAENMGLVNRVVPSEELVSTCLDMAGKIAKNGQVAVRYSKSAINRGVEINIETGLSIESDLFSLCFSTDDQIEGMAAFIEKRSPAFNGY